MKAGRSFHCLFWALLYCVLYLVSANEDELMDFDFTDTKSGVADWNYLDDELSSQQTQAKQDQQKLESNMLDFTVEMEDADAQNKVPPFDWRERALRYALSKALTDRALRQKFVEVMPILRVLSSQQRLALSALISAQMNAKHGHELRLEQVRMMFGDDKKLLLPIVYDLANLVKNSARKYINMGSDFAAAALLRTPMQIQKRKHVLTVEEQAEEDDTIGTIAVDAAAKPGEDDSSLEDFFDEMQSEVLDPQLINEALQGNVSKNSTNTTTTPMASTRKTSSMSKSHGKRVRRAAKSSEFVHKLTRSVPLSANEEDLLRGAAGRTIQLNTTAFLQPSENTRQIMPTNATQSYVEVEDLAFAGLNGTELELNANDRTDQAQEEPLPSPEELIAGPRYRFNKVHGMRPSQKVPIKRKRLQPSSRGRPKPAASSYSPAVTAAPRKCERFTSNMCIRTDDYPL
ncbi:neurotrophin 1 [Scaptodrosophila lebanonensis]|uniref:Neurotrophin 1 n=1 Tax=Drosophila lebanonensis TaxID=7225 RepID=A0A6J2TDJ6_DROLE|nr:neurotrophin 1 [Scaptodrosophila lebanonensis]